MLSLLDDRRGTLLFMTLSVVVLLSLLSVSVARHLALEIRLMRYQLGREQAKLLARNGVYLAMVKLIKDGQDTDEAYDWLGDDWSLLGQNSSQGDLNEWVIDIPRGSTNDLRLDLRLQVKITDEGSRYNVNIASVTQVETLVGSLEAAEAIVDHIDPDLEENRVIEDPPYQPKDASIVRIEELFQIPEVSQDMRQRLSEFGRATLSDEGVAININTAEEEVLIALTDESMRTTVEQLVASRSGLDGIFGTVDDCVAMLTSTAGVDLADCAFAGDDALIISLLSKLSYGVGSSVFRIESVGRVESPDIGYYVETVISRAKDSAKILSWKEGPQARVKN